MERALLVEFDPDSAWYETSLTIAAEALRNGYKTLYDTLQHPPADIEHDMRKFGLDLGREPLALPMKLRASSIVNQSWSCLRERPAACAE